MDADEFARTHPPGRTNPSRLAEHRDVLLQLRKDGYTLIQLKTWLASNGIAISLEGIRKYLLRASKETQNKPAKGKEEASPTPALPDPSQLTSEELKEARKSRAQRFIQGESSPDTNTLLDNLLKGKK